LPFDDYYYYYYFHSMPFRYYFAMILPRPPSPALLHSRILPIAITIDFFFYSIRILILLLFSAAITAI